MQEIPHKHIIELYVEVIRKGISMHFAKHATDTIRVRFTREACAQYDIFNFSVVVKAEELANENRAKELADIVHSKLISAFNKHTKDEYK